MSSGPRKFSEKIALLNQKQAEQNAAFISIISEVKSIRPTQQSFKTTPNSFINSTNNFIIGNNQQNFQTINQNTITVKDQNALNTTFLQLPSQSDSFRRAHSDSSLHQSSIGNNINHNPNNNQVFPNSVKINPNDNLNNNCFGMLDPGLCLNSNQTPFMNFNLNNYQETHSLPLNYGNYQNISQNMQNQVDLSHKTSNSLMPQSPLNPNQNTFASLPDLTTFNYNQNDISMQDTSLIPNHNQHNLIGALKPTHHSTSPTRITTRYSPTHSNRRLSPQRSDKYQSPIQNLNPRNNYGIQNNSIVHGNLFRNNNPNESMPPSPKSQPSCFNSPQGSPGPHSISPQDINPFSCNNYESMQKKFDMFNLEPTHPPPYNAYNSTQKLRNNSKNVINGTGGSGTSISVCTSPNSNLTNNCANKNNIENSNNEINNHKNNLSTQSPNLVDNINYNKQLINSNHQIIQHSNSNRGNEIIDNTDNRSNFNVSLTNEGSNISSTPLFCSASMNNNCPSHKNSIPDIILTFSDSTEDKNDFVKVLSSDLYNDCNTKTDDSLDFENLQIFGETIESQDVLSLDGINQQMLQYPDSS